MTRAGSWTVYLAVGRGSGLPLSPPPPFAKSTPVMAASRGSANRPPRNPSGRGHRTPSRQKQNQRVRGKHRADSGWPVRAAARRGHDEEEGVQGALVAGSESGSDWPNPRKIPAPAGMRLFGDCFAIARKRLNFLFLLNSPYLHLSNFNWVLEIRYFSSQLQELKRSN